MAGLAHVAALRFADLDGHAFGLMDVAAEKMFGLMLLNEIAQRGGSGMDAGAHLVERGAVRRRVANQDQRRETGEALQSLRHLRFAVLSRRLKRRRAGI